MPIKAVKHLRIAQTDSYCQNYPFFPHFACKEKMARDLWQKHVAFHIRLFEQIQAYPPDKWGGTELKGGVSFQVGQF